MRYAKLRIFLNKYDSTWSKIKHCYTPSSISVCPNHNIFVVICCSSFRKYSARKFMNNLKARYINNTTCTLYVGSSSTWSTVEWNAGQHLVSDGPCSIVVMEFQVANDWTFPVFECNWFTPYIWSTLEWHSHD